MLTFFFLSLCCYFGRKINNIYKKGSVLSHQVTLAWLKGCIYKQSQCIKEIHICSLVLSNSLKITGILLIKTSGTTQTWSRGPDYRLRGESETFGLAAPFRLNFWAWLWLTWESCESTACLSSRKLEWKVDTVVHQLSQDSTLPVFYKCLQL